MTDVRKAFAGLAVIAAVAVDALGMTGTTQLGAAAALPPAGANGVVVAAGGAPVQVAAQAQIDQLNPLATKRRRKPH